MMGFIKCSCGAEIRTVSAAITHKCEPGAIDAVAHDLPVVLGSRHVAEVMEIQRQFNAAMDAQMNFWSRPCSLMMLPKRTWWVRVQLFFYRNWWKLFRASK